MTRPVVYLPLGRHSRRRDRRPPRAAPQCPGKGAGRPGVRDLKSNRDGSRPGHVTVFVAVPDRLESLEWGPGEEVETLAIATMDWPRFLGRPVRDLADPPRPARRRRATLTGPR